MELYENKFIYVINHCLNSIDGERIEIFEIIKENNDVINLNYIKSIKLPEQFLSATNGIAVVTEDDFFSQQVLVYILLPLTKQIFLIKKCLFLL